MTTESRIPNLLQRIKSPFPAGYGRSIPIIAQELISSTVREKRFFIALLYFVAVPLSILVLGTTTPVIQRGTGIALFQAQTNTAGFLKAFYLSFFLGQLLLVILTADQISGEIEQNTFSLLRSKPVFDSEIIIGKFLGMVAVIALFDVPTVFIIYFTYFARFNGEFPGSYIQTLDEVVGVIVLLLLLQCLIISFTMIFSTIFSKSLYAILSSMLTLFVLDRLAGIFGSAGNYLQLLWLFDAVLPGIFYHLDSIKGSAFSELQLVFGIVMTIVGFNVIAILFLRNKEIF